MALEIERKFLIKSIPWSDDTPCQKLYQGYLGSNSPAVIRVRADDQARQAWLTIKGPVQNITREEFEYDIPWEDSLALRKMCHHVIEKTRRKIHYIDQIWELDEFHGDNQGLIIAELELSDETAVWVPPPWIGTEITHDFRYYNNNLASIPWTSWV